YLLCQAEFRAAGVTCQVATDDGSRGHHGFVTDLLQDHLEQVDCAATTVYSCGPLPMIGAVAALCRRFQTRCYVSLEEAMPCGVGVCNGCVVPVHSAVKNSQESGTVEAPDPFSSYRRICVEGPVVDASELNWEKL